MIALDTSVAIPLVIASHEAHDTVLSRLRRDEVCLSGHAAAETYSVLTRLPGDLRLRPEDATAALTEGFAPTVFIGTRTQRRLLTVLSDAGIAGGSVFDGLVALAARDHDLTLVTRDVRATPIYSRLGLAFEVIGS